MDGNIGFYTIKPDQIQVISPLLVLIFIPLFEVGFYPLLSLIGIRRPLQKIALGGLFSNLAFVLSMIVEINLEKTYPVLPVNGATQLRVFNGLNCDYDVYTNLSSTVQIIKLPSNSHFFEINVAVGESKSFPFTLSSDGPQC